MKTQNQAPRLNVLHVLEEAFPLSGKPLLKYRHCLFAAIFALALPASVQAADVTWTAGSGSLNAAANWSSNPALPGPGDNVIFINSGALLFSSTANLTNASASFTDGTGRMQLGVSDTWTLTDGLSANLASGKYFAVESGTVAVTNGGGTATATFGSTSTRGSLRIAGGTFEADVLNITGTTGGNNQGLIFDEGLLKVHHGATISASGVNLTFGSLTGKTATAKFLGGSSSLDASAVFIGTNGKGDVTVDGAATTLSFNGGSFVTGYSAGSDNNVFTVSSGAKVTLNLSVGVVLGYNDTATGNIVNVTGSNSRLELPTGNITIGKGNSKNNQLIVADGGSLSLGTPDKSIYIGEGSDSSGNILRVTGEGSLVETATTGAGSYIGVGMSGTNNHLEITDGGRINAVRFYAGVLAGAKGNSATVTTGGILHIIDTIYAKLDPTNTISISDGGVLQFATATPGISVSDGGTITLGDGGILSFTGISNAPTSAVNNLTYSGVDNGLRLDNAQNASVTTYTFQSGTPGTYARLELKNNSTWNSTGTLIIGHGGALVGDGTVNGAVTVQSGGSLAIGHSPGTMVFNDDLTLNSGSLSEFEIHGLTTGLYDLAQGGTGTQAVAFDGTLNLLFSAGFNTLGSVKIFDFENYSGTFSTVNTSGLATGYTAEFDASNGLITVVPEPETWVLLGLGLGIVLFRLRRGRRLC